MDIIIRGGCAVKCAGCPADPWRYVAGRVRADRSARVTSNGCAVIIRGHFTALVAAGGARGGRGGHSRARGTPGGGRPSARRGSSVADSGPARLACARPPSAVAPASRRFRRPCARDAPRCPAAGARRGGGGSRSPCPPAAWRDAGAADRAGAAPAAPRPPARRAARRRGGSPPSARRRGGCRAGRPPPGASGPVCRGPAGAGRPPGPLVCRAAGAVRARPTPVELPRPAEPVEQDARGRVPDARRLPVAPPPPAGAPAPAAPRGRQVLPRAPRLAHLENPAQRRPIRLPRGAALRRRRVFRQQRRDRRPPRVVNHIMHPHPSEAATSMPRR